MKTRLDIRKRSGYSSVMSKFKWFERRDKFQATEVMEAIGVTSIGSFGRSEITPYTFADDRGRAIGRMLLRRPRKVQQLPEILVETLEVNDVLNKPAHFLAALLWTVELSEIEGAVLSTNPAGVPESEAKAWLALAEQGIAHEWEAFTRLGSSVDGEPIYAGSYQVMPELTFFG
jgi:hypothetical protein